MTDPLSQSSINAATCAQCEERLMAYLERELSDSERAWMDAHRTACASCNAMVVELESLVAQASALPTITPERDLWDGVARRIDAPVVALPLAGSAAPVATSSVARPSEKRGVSVRWFAVAATLLVAVSSAVTWRIARARPDATVATDSRPIDSVRGVRVMPVANAGVVYEQEISALRTIVNERFSELDSSTVIVLKHNLEIIDQAIRESRAALAKDPNSRVLSTTLDRALESKLTLMRRVALL